MVRWAWWILVVWCLNFSNFELCDCQSEDGFAEAQSPAVTIPSEMELVPRRTVELAALSIDDPVINGTRTAYILQTTTAQFQMVLQLEDVGNQSFCWAAVVDVVNPYELAWRSPCQPVRATRCVFRFTRSDDIQLYLPDTMTVAWHTNTTGSGARILRILDYGNWLVLRARTEIVWQTSQFPVPRNCLIPGPILLDNATVYAPPSPPPVESADASRPVFLPAASCFVGIVIIYLVV